MIKSRSVASQHFHLSWRCNHGVVPCPIRHIDGVMGTCLLFGLDDI